VRAYRDILRTPHLAALLAASVVARLPIGINALATVLFLREETGSFAIAGAASGAIALGVAVGAPVNARLIDRMGPSVMLALAAGHAAGLGALVALGYADAPAPLLIAAAFVAGVAAPPTSSVMRALYPRLLTDPGQVQAAYALDSVSTQVIFVTGPLLTALLVALVAPAAALALSGTVVLVGVAVFLATMPDDERRRAPNAGRSVSRLGALSAPGIRSLVLAMVPVGFAFGSLEVALPAFADAEGKREVAGVLLACWSVGSGIGGLIYGARLRRAPLVNVHLRMAVLLPIGLAPLALAPSLPVMALLAFPAGAFIAPLIATRNELAGHVAPTGSETEAFTWPLTALVSGVALGAAAAGALVDATSWRVPLIVGTCTAAVGAAVAISRRRTLEAQAAVVST
jgi:MFS family permease